ncbi:hypothetical protein FDECE_15424 [Fusarium decemcellulare]|nr:hypothetical protein FDECE_15424 [Fusarium decemcellulare]
MSQVKGYTVGDIKAEAAFTSEIVLNGSPTLQDFVNYQDKDRQIMVTRPGMYLKYLPHRFDAVDGQLLSGGAYLFDTHANAQDYWDWTTDKFEVGEPKTKFWNQPLFKSSKRFVWDVIGATNFKPVEVHAVGRFQRWSYAGAGDNAADALRAVFLALKKAAQGQGAASFWLLHHPREKKIAIQLTFEKVEDGDSATVGQRSLHQVTSQPSLGELFPRGLNTTNELDRTSLFIALWLPTSSSAGGVAQTHPMYPVLPVVTV